MKTRSFPSTLFAFLLAAGSIGHAQTPPEPAPSPSQSPPTASPSAGKVTQAATIDITNEPIVRVVANVLPAVVNINTQKTVPEYVTAYDRYFRLYRGTINRTAQSIGSGLLISADGYIITNAHVVALADEGNTVSITLSSGLKYQATIISADEDADLALLKIDEKSVQFPYFDLSYVSPDILGETVVALGSPEGFQNSVSHGILSAKGRSFTVEDHTYTNLIQTDAAINPGNSGGPLVDLNGGLVGINSAKMSGQAIENIGFAIPHETVVAWANDAMGVARGTKTAATPAVSALEMMHQRLGLSLSMLTEDKAQEMNLDLPGALVVSQVEDGSPASDVGLREGMIIVAVNNQQVADEKSLPRELQHLHPGSKVRLQVMTRQSLGLISLQRIEPVELTAR